MSEFPSARASVRFCPQCGARSDGGAAVKFFECAACSYRLYLNPTVSACPLIFREDGKLLLVRRARDPQKGLLGIPGGFVDAGESVEEALRRELHEELKLSVTEWAFFGGWPNVYPYRGVSYDVLDLYFLVRATGEIQPEASEIVGFEWRDLASLDPAEIAFPSLRAALIELCSGTKMPPGPQ